MPKISRANGPSYPDDQEPAYVDPELTPEDLDPDNDPDGGNDRGEDAPKPGPAKKTASTRR